MPHVDLANFDNPWEHIRLLSDRARNQALVDLLRRHAPGKRVLEVGCGTGLLSCIAAAAGAERVYAVEPTPLAEHARAMVRANGLEDRVVVLEAKVEDLPPEPVDLAFSELLNADPFEEGVFEAMVAARPWVVEGGLWAPRRLKVWAAAIHQPTAAREVRMARSEVARLAEEFGLDLSDLDGLMAAPGPSTSVSEVDRVATKPALLWDLAIGWDGRPTEPTEVALYSVEPSPIGGVAVWFEAELDDGLEHHNRPGEQSHWGQLVSHWPIEVGLPKDGLLTIRATPTDRGLVVEQT